MKQKLKNHFPWLIILIGFIILIQWNPIFTRRLEWKFSDLCFRWGGKKLEFSNLRIITYTEEDDRKFVDIYQALFELIPEMKSSRVTGINIQGIPWNPVYLKTIRNNGNVFYAFSSFIEKKSQNSPEQVYTDFLPLRLAPVISDTETGTFFSISNVRFTLTGIQSIAGLGGNMLLNDPDGICRKTPLLIRYGNRLLLNFGVQIARYYLTGKREYTSIYNNNYLTIENIKIPLNKNSLYTIPYPGDFKNINRISFTEFSNLPTPENYIKDKIVILTDGRPVKRIRVNTPVLADMDNTLVQALIAESVIRNRSIRTGGILTKILISLLLGMLIYVIALRYAPTLSIFILLTMSAGYTIFCIYSLRYGISFPLFFPLLSICCFWITGFIKRYLKETEQREYIRNIFGRYLSQNVLDRVMTDEDFLKLSGRKKTLTILFADIRRFTSLAEKLPPEKVVSFLNRFFSVMIEVIFRYEGTLDKLLGDGLMVFFGDPVQQPDHAERAVLCAVAMQKSLETMNREYSGILEEDCQMGIGINTGEAVVGNLGSTDYIDYTVIGDTVNLAARLEENAKGGSILIGSGTLTMLDSTRFHLEHLSPIYVKGKSSPTNIARVQY